LSGLIAFAKTGLPIAALSDLQIAVHLYSYLTNSIYTENLNAKDYAKKTFTKGVFYDASFV
jgi:hypothetical protein